MVDGSTDYRRLTPYYLFYSLTFVFILQTNTADRSLDSIETREFTPDGKYMTLIHTMPADPSIKSVRVYKRMEQ